MVLAQTLLQLLHYLKSKEKSMLESTFPSDKDERLKGKKIRQIRFHSSCKFWTAEIAKTHIEKKKTILLKASFNSIIQQETDGLKLVLPQLVTQ